ncbi:hypothetical protein BEWA_017860 [Theileria equi strain WA]|uniref:CS domain-containing protein n=1 Tax=Theileria equi strain WA TaxID=1537102 RepID=L0ATT0_THEEQ|nr:hypothetical protein BEWA_017860 [Theileria equi strain WA]AFZ78945.1 hypothetical protein BEWA_017860 [Theileria equi strain WA]|eukprot:XP_004828611.1 hypothetical protein BEWA_017860 [Theileria equi strain WA]
MLFSIKCVVILIIFSQKCKIRAYLQPSNFKGRIPILSKHEINSKGATFDDNEVANSISERNKEEIMKYLNPMSIEPVKTISQQELAETFGTPSTPENLLKKKRQYQNSNPLDPPNYPPTDKLPYFVNLEHPSGFNKSQDISSNIEDSADTGHIKENPEDENVSIIASSHPNTYDDPYEEEEEDNFIKDMSYKDPLIDLMDTNKDYEPDDNVKYGPTWYRKRHLNDLLPAEFENGWSILECGTIYKHILRHSMNFDDDKMVPDDESCNTFSFKILNAFTNEKILDMEDLNTQMVTAYSKDTGDVIKRCLKSMECGEQAEFIFHVSEYNPDNEIIEELEGVEWLRLWLDLFDVHDSKKRWWGLSSLDAHLYPQEKPSNKTKMEKLDLEAEELKKKMEVEMATNPASPLWEDVLKKMNSSQRETYVEHFDKQLEKSEKMKCSEYSGSRGFGESIKSTGQIRGYDVGRFAKGVSKFYTWKETLFKLYIAIPVVDGVRAEHVKLELTHNHLKISVAGNTILDDDFTGKVDVDAATTWVMSEANEMIQSSNLALFGCIKTIHTI